MKQINKTFKYVERGVILTLALIMAAVIIVASVELFIIVFNEITNEVGDNGLWLDISELMVIFGFFLNILIGLELFETIKLYIKEDVFHGEVILIVALIAVARKVIVLDYTKEDPITVIAIGILVAAISLGYYLIKKTLRS